MPDYVTSTPSATDCGVIPCGDIPDSPMCNPDLAALPPSPVFDLVGVVGTCFVKPDPKACGFVYKTATGTIVSRALPVSTVEPLRDYQRDDEGKAVTDANGLLIEFTPPAFDSILVDKGGVARRVRGKGGVEQQMIWDGNQMTFRDYNPLKDALNGAKEIQSACGSRFLVATPTTECRVVDGQSQAFASWNFAVIADPLEQMIGLAMICPFEELKLSPNWTALDGKTLSKTQFPDLFERWGYRYGGSGDGFSAPDMRGVYVRGWDNGRLRDSEPARALGSYQGDAIIQHSHSDSGGEVKLSAYVKMGYESTGKGALGAEAAYGPEFNHGSTNVAVNFSDSNLNITIGDVKSITDGPQVTKTSETRVKNIAMNFVTYLGCPQCN